MSALLDAPEIARRLNVSRATAYREIRGRMLHVVVGKRALRVTEAAFAAYLDRRTAPPTAQRSTAPAKRPGPATRTATAPPPATSVTDSAAAGGDPDRRLVRLVHPRIKPPPQPDGAQGA